MSARTSIIQVRVSEEEQAQVEALVSGLDTAGAREYGKQLAKRLAVAAPFATPADFLRVCLNMEPLREAGDPTTGRPKKDAPSKAALHKRASRGDEEAKRLLAEMGVVPRSKKGRE